MGVKITEETPKEKIIEKRYIEITASYKQRFIQGLLGGLGWGIGITLGTSALLIIIGYFISRMDFVPILGNFLADVIKAAQPNLRVR